MLPKGKELKSILDTAKLKAVKEAGEQRIKDAQRERR